MRQVCEGEKVVAGVVRHVTDVAVGVRVWQVWSGCSRYGTAGMIRVLVG